jgi:hypothetical protein
LTGLGIKILPAVTDIVSWVNRFVTEIGKNKWLRDILSGAALGVAGLAVASKITKAFDAVKGLFGASQQAVQTGLLEQIAANTALIAGEGGVSGPVGRIPLGLGAALGIAGGAALALQYAGSHGPQTPPELQVGGGYGGRARPDLMYPKIFKEYQAFLKAGGTPAEWTGERTAYLKSGHTVAQWNAGGATITHGTVTIKVS